MEKLTIFTLPGCGKCKVMKAKMTAAGIDYEECQDVEKMQNMGIVSTPALLLGSGELIKDFSNINSIVQKLSKGDSING